MGITINNDAITIESEILTFEDIYQYAVTSNNTKYIKKLNSSYYIKVNLILRNNSHLVDTNKSITIDGELLQIHKGCSLRLGDKKLDDSTYNGCLLNMPNVNFGYGFGCKDIDDSGDLFLYDSIINIFGFWGFFEGSNHIEIINCFIDGFGRISGPKSIIKNVSFKRSHGRYGLISTKGNILSMEGMRVSDSDPYENNKCSIYHNPKYTPNLDIYYGEYSGYDSLVFIEPILVKCKLTLYGSVIKGNYKLERQGNHIDFYHKFKFKSTLYDSSGNKVVSVRVIIKDKNGKIVYNDMTDSNGQIDTWITYYEDLDGEADILTPHTIEINSSEYSAVSKIYINKNYKDHTLHLSISNDKSNNVQSQIEEILHLLNKDKENINPAEVII